MKVRTTKITTTKQGKQPPGTIIDHPDAHLLVKLGVAEPYEEPVAAEPETEAEDE